MQPVVVLDVVGLTPRHLGTDTPNLSALAAEGGARPMTGVLPAVTCSAQATMLTGVSPSAHGIVGNGWHHRDTDEIRFWLQSENLLRTPPVYVTARERFGDDFTCAKLFWWFNETRAVDWRLTPKPHYATDGAKALAIAGAPRGLATDVERRCGRFPFPAFWGPMAGLPSTEWIAKASAYVIRSRTPTLSLVYLPHLDYDLQRFGATGPHLAQNLRDVDACAGAVIEAAREIGARVVVVSEYGLTDVSRPVYVNRVLRDAGWLHARPGPFGERLALHASDVVAVPDHQVAHLTVRDPNFLPRVAERFAAEPGVAAVLDAEGKRAAGLDHARAGDLVLLAERDAWFAYPWWSDDRAEPDFARTVNIHAKPGYDPAELFFDPALRFPKWRVAWRLAQKKLGLRYRLDVVPTDASLVRGSHGLPPEHPEDGPVFIADTETAFTNSEPVAMTDVAAIVMRLLASA